MAELGVEFTKADEEALSAGKFFYTLHFKNVGGLIMPVIFQITYEDGTKEIVRIPAEIWRKNVNEVHKTIITNKPAISFQLDPLEETADIQLNNNQFPRKNIEKFDEFKEK